MIWFSSLNSILLEFYFTFFKEAYSSSQEYSFYMHTFLLLHRDQWKNFPGRENVLCSTWEILNFIFICANCYTIYIRQNILKFWPSAKCPYVLMAKGVYVLENILLCRNDDGNGKQYSANGLEYERRQCSMHTRTHTPYSYYGIGYQRNILR